MDGFTEISKLFKERENPKAFSVEIGTIINALPDIKIRLGDEGKIILTKDNIFFASSVLGNHKRDFTMDSDISFSQMNCGVTDSSNVGNHGSHFHNVSSIDINTKQTSIGTITLKEYLQLEDQVILIPTSDNQKYYLIDKVVEL